VARVADHPIIFLQQGRDSSNPAVGRRGATTAEERVTMPKKPTTTAARRAREAAQSGGKYTEALREAEAAQSPEKPATGRLDRFGQAREMFANNLAALRELDDNAVYPRDPWRMSAILDARAGVWMELAEAAPDSTPSEWRQAAHYAAILDQEQAARIRYAAGIPTLFPGAQASQLHLDEMLCRSCGQPWQSPNPCEQCPRILWGTTPKTREQAQSFPAGEPWLPDADEHRDAAEDQVPLKLMVEKAAAERAASIRHPRWYRPGRRPEAVDIINRVFFPADESADRREISVSWRNLLQELAEVRGEITAHQAALEAAREARKALEYTGPQRHYAAGTRRAEAASSRIWNELKRAQERYVQLAVHALAAAAGEADPATLPEQPEPDALTFTEPEPVEPHIPEALAALGYALAHLHKAMPTSGRVAEGLQADYDRVFGIDDDHECYSEDGRCDCDPYYIPEHMGEQAEELEDEISDAWQAYHEETIVWADSVCIALATELRPRVLAHKDTHRGWRG
jgi:hypothetical protein